MKLKCVFHLVTVGLRSAGGSYSHGGRRAGDAAAGGGPASHLPGLRDGGIPGVEPGRVGWLCATDTAAAGDSHLRLHDGSVHDSGNHRAEVTVGQCSERTRSVVVGRIAFCELFQSKTLFFLNQFI